MSATASHRPRAWHPPGDQGFGTRLPGGDARGLPDGSTTTSTRWPSSCTSSAPSTPTCFPAAAGQLIDAREKAFWMAKANGADDVVDIVVPRAQIPAFMEKVAAWPARYEGLGAGCGLPRATATSTWGSSAGTSTVAPVCCTPSGGPASLWEARSRASTGSVRGQAGLLPGARGDPGQAGVDAPDQGHVRPRQDP